MARYDYGDRSGSWFDVQQRQVVYDIHHHRFEPDQLCICQSLRPGTFVVVTANGGRGRNRRELLQYLLTADIPRMDDVVAAAQERTGLRPQQTVRVRDEANAKQVTAPSWSALCGRADTR